MLCLVSLLQLDAYLIKRWLPRFPKSASLPLPCLRIRATAAPKWPTTPTERTTLWEKSRTALVARRKKSTRPIVKCNEKGRRPINNTSAESPYRDACCCRKKCDVANPTMEACPIKRSSASRECYKSYSTGLFLYMQFIDRDARGEEKGE